MMDIYYFVLVIPCLIFSLIVQAVLKSTYSKYSNVYSSCGLTGADIARRVMEINGVYNVSVAPVSGTLTDHYDPQTNTVYLSQGVYGSSSLAALGVAAHEAGHAVQMNEKYAPLVFRNSIVPAVNLASKLSWWIFIIGLLLGFLKFAELGVILFGFSTLFHLVTLPVELNASRRATAMLSGGYLNIEEIKGTKKVLSAAAMTYVAALAVSVMQLLRFISLLGGRRR